MKTIFLFTATLFLTAQLGAQSLTVDWFTVDGGGGASSDGSLNIAGTAGQPDAGVMSDGTLKVQGGFWPAFTATSASTGGATSYKVFYSTQSGAPGLNYVGVVNSDGSGNIHVLDTACWPRISRDGSKMLYHPVVNSTGNFARNDLAIYNFTTSNSTTIFGNYDYVVYYDWLADGTNVVFDFGCGIYRWNAGSATVDTIFNVDCYDDAPSVNPVNGSLAFHNTYQGLMLANSDGSNRRHLANTQAGDYWANWSPDGQWLCFVNASGYWKINADGSGRTNLWSNLSGATNVKYNGADNEGSASFSPDGQWVIAAFNLNGTNGIYALTADGSGTVKTLLTTGNATDQTYNFIGGVLPTTNYDGSNLLLNPGAEAGSPLYWTVGGNSNPGVDNGIFDSNIPPRSGNFDFYGHTGANGSLSQVVALLNVPGVTAQKIDSGIYQAAISFWECNLGSANSQNDDAYVSLDFLDASQTLISRVSTPEVNAGSSAWQNYAAQYAVPANTRYIRYTMNFVRHVGTDLDAFIDDNSLTLVDTSTLTVPPVMTISATSPVQATISWTPATPGFVLQESDNLTPANWSNSASGAQNPVTVSTGSTAKFYRLVHP